MDDFHFSPDEHGLRFRHFSNIILEKAHFSSCDARLLALRLEQAMRVLARTGAAENTPPPLEQTREAQLDHRCDAPNVIACNIVIYGKPISTDAQTTRSVFRLVRRFADFGSPHAPSAE